MLDTHVLLWWTLEPGRLSATAAARLHEMERLGGFASSISIWELAVKIQRGKLELGIPIGEFVRRIGATGVRLLAVDSVTWLRSVELAWDHRDPADRVIVATALLQNVPLVTADTEIHRFGGVECVW